MVLPKHNALIEVHGCFWHGHGCRYFKHPTANAGFWQNKIMGNQIRDRRNLGKQLEAGWRCLVVWECAVRMSQRGTDTLDVVSLTAEWLTSGGQLAIIDELGLCNLTV
jgi:DNA mismatch endonuclease (patch repair protein)